MVWCGAVLVARERERDSNREREREDDGGRRKWVQWFSKNGMMGGRGGKEMDTKRRVKKVSREK